MADITYLNTVGRNPAAEAAARSSSAVHCLLLPMGNRPVLLPNAAVAEIVAYNEPEALAGSPDWLLGMVTWRDRRVPLISFEVATGDTFAPPNAVSRIAVVNTLSGNQRLPYIGILTQAIPQLRLVNDDNTKPHEGAPTESSVAAVVEINGEVVAVPDIDDLERRLERLQQSSPGIA
ncbi:MAG TPA: chemotaxis protein CheW [Gammaproteobacteria bacterium]|nr:chemotaxis protein CheW [Gammaproteobacteria bacterium]